MKTTNKVLLYDDYCPLCSWYSGLFVKFGLLRAANRIAFSKADLSVLTAIDLEKGKDEIPLFDPETRETVYGIDALLEILDPKIPFIRRVGNCKPVKWLLKKLYKLISYNRKVIVARKCGPGVYDCSPTFSPLYRMAFLIFFLVFNSWMLLPLHDHIFSQLSFYHINSGQLQAGHLIFVGINCGLAVSLGRKAGIEYLGQVNMLAVLSILLLSLLLLFHSMTDIPESLILFFLACITLFIGREYYRRMKYAGIWAGHKKIIGINIVCLIAFLYYVFQ